MIMPIVFCVVQIIFCGALVLGFAIGFVIGSVW